MARTEQEWMQFQADIRAIKFDPNTTDEEKATAQAQWDEAMVEYQKQHPLITGTFIYTDELKIGLSDKAKFYLKFVVEDGERAATENEEERAKRETLVTLLHQHRATCARCQRWALADYSGPLNVLMCLKRDPAFPFLDTVEDVIRTALPILRGIYYKAAIQAEQEAISRSIEQQLLQASIPVGTWGTGKAKSLQSLVDEIEVGESTLVSHGGTLYRELSVARINVYVHRDGQTLRLVETKQEFLLSDGSVRPRVREHLEYSLSEKLHANENVQESAARAVQEELGLASVESCEVMGATEETVESASYPGLLTRYLFQNFAVFLKDEDYREEYIEDQSSAATDPKLVYFGWQPIAPCGRCGGTEEPLDAQGMCWHCRI